MLRNRFLSPVAELAKSLEGAHPEGLEDRTWSKVLPLRLRDFCGGGYQAAEIRR